MISTTSLPNGQVGSAYSTSLAASGGTSPYKWALNGGLLPTGLSLNASAGTITGTPTASANATALKFTVTDSGNPAQSQSVTLNLTISSAALTITTTSLPNGQVGSAYSATLAASGGTSPYMWTLTSGSLPTGLSLNASAGTITGTPTASANGTSLMFSVDDSSTPVQSQPVTLAITVDPANLSVGVSPKRAAVVTGQALSITPTTNDFLGVNWTVSGLGCSGTACGTFSTNNSKTGVPVTFTAATSPGVYTVSASSSYNSSLSTSLSVAVTDFAGVTTYHNNLSRNGANTQEYALSTASVATSSFGKLYACPVDGAIYAQPLWMPNLTISSTKRNVVFVATQHDSLYAFDADNNSNPCTPLWHANLVDSGHGGLAGETSIPSGITGAPISTGDIMPEVGVTGTPVIDPATKTIYVVSKSWVSSNSKFYQRLHAIDLLTGNEKFSGPVTIAATFPGKGDGGTMTTFLPGQQNQRPGLALVNGVVYIAWSSHGDALPYYGWVIGYNASNLSQVSVFNDAPNVMNGGIWMAGGAPAADSSNNLYLLTGNAIFDAANTSAPNNDYGDAFLKLNSNLAVVQYFSPSDQATDNSGDEDFGAGGAAVLADVPTNGSNPTHFVIGGGKDGALYLLNRDKLGGSGDSNAWQRISTGNGIYATGAFWNSHFYIGGFGAALSDYVLNSATAKLSLAKTAATPVFGFPGATPSVSSMPDYSNGIVWALDQTNYCTEQATACGPVVLHAYDATNIATELWNSSQGAGNAGGNAVKFTVPTIANGKVFVGTRGNNAGDVDTSTSTPGELDIYGLLPN
ncbi:MAG: putative Ig domain-containing protein [Terracidiphilus sp.]